ncbi:MAG: aromatic ring-hydroxylating dioxygenase subunit alpha [Alphaproteobacteria bacterium]|nr:aromatic ring-hydroxylating dioxygenase subunit alpha [Alphaproteobacteria bacterium]MCB9929732.1 Rieske 2Fe-2S domain-containing protein [Alphaproteobacteria bacterium]
MTQPAPSPPIAWPAEGLTRVPNRLYADPDIHALEQARIFQGPTWNFVGLEAEIPKAGDFKTGFVGETPVIVVRDREGGVNVLENRCAHRGALVCLKEHGNARSLACVYHAWNYSLKGDLIGVAFERGVKGQGGMPPGFDKANHGLRKLRVATLNGLIFATFHPETPPLDAYLGPDILARIRRVTPRPLVPLGHSRQVMHNNWKLYVENVKDSYHASLLHAFFTTFKLNRLTMQGGIVVDGSGGHHVSWSKAAEDAQTRTEYESGDIRAHVDDMALADPNLIAGHDEFGDGVTLQILTVFPNFVMQQIRNALAVRLVLPKGPDRTELVWTYYGFADDDTAMLQTRQRQSNLVGPAGYISMEDGCVGGFVQRGIAGAADERSVVQMGGDGAETQATRATETSVRGFWKAYRPLMGL